MNSFDHSILEFFNQFVGRHGSFDKAVVFLSNNGFYRGGILTALIWWAWFKEKDADKSKAAREGLAASVFACGLSIFLARVIVALLPFRIRPISDPTNGFHFPLATVNWAEWSSFPSDHAILFGAFTTCLFFISASMGWIAVLDTVFLVCLPRIYLGIHYPTDTLAGLAIGVGVGLLANGVVFRKRIGGATLSWMTRHPGSFYAFSFLFTYQLTVMFYDVRTLAEYIIKLVQKLFTAF